MGVGKSSVSRKLLEMLPAAVWLDGDWCWNPRPFVVNQITKSVVLDNVCHCLNNFITCGQYQNIIFSWVMHRQDIIDDILSALNASGVKVVNISLICTTQALESRLRGDIQSGLRMADVVERAMERLKCYAALDTIKIDTTQLTVQQVAEKIQPLI